MSVPIRKVSSIPIGTKSPQQKLIFKLSVVNSIKPKPVVFIIYGGTGDLSWRKLGPAIYNLFLNDWMPEQFAVIGIGRRPLTHAEFGTKLLEGINQFSRTGKAEPSQWEKFSKHIFYQSCDIYNAESY